MEFKRDPDPGPSGDSGTVTSPQVQRLKCVIDYPLDQYSSGVQDILNNTGIITPVWSCSPMGLIVGFLCALMISGYIVRKAWRLDCPAV